MRKLLFFAGAMLLFFGCQNQPQKGYRLIATVGDVPDSTEVYLRYSLDGERVTDTAYIVGNKFTFSDTIETPFRASLEIKRDGGIRDFATVYIEKGDIIVTSADSIKNAEIVSPINALAKEWEETTKSLTESSKELTAFYYAASKEERDTKEFKEKVEAWNDSLQIVQKSLALDFIAAHPDSYFSLNTLYPSVIGYDPDTAEAEKVFAMFSPELQASKAGQEAADRIAKWKSVAIGAVAPDFTQNDPDGNPVKLSDFRGKYLLIDFWASWCGPCRAENPNVVKAYNKFKNKNFTILGVSLDQPEGKDRWLKAVADDKLTWTQVSDLKYWNNEAAALYAVRAIPANFLLDPDGVIIGKNLRGKDLEDKLAEVLK